MSHVFIVWGYCWEIKWKRQWNTRISGPMYMISSVAKFGNVLPNLWMLELRTIFIFCGKVGNGWIEGTFLIRSFDSERALSYVEMWEKIYLWWKFIWLMKREKRGKEEREQVGTWRHLWRKDHRERNDMMYRGQSDEPVWQVGYKRLCSLTNSVSSKREIKLSTASHCFSNLIVIMVSRTISVANSSSA